MSSSMRGAVPSSRSKRSEPSGSRRQWTSVPDVVRYVPGSRVAIVVVRLPVRISNDELEWNASRWDPAMIGVVRRAIAVAERAVPHHDPAHAVARSRGKVRGIPTLEVNDRRHDAPPPHDVVRPSIANVTIAQRHRTRRQALHERKWRSPALIPLGDPSSEHD